MSNEKFTEQFPTAAVPALHLASWYWWTGIVSGVLMIVTVQNF